MAQTDTVREMVRNAPIEGEDVQRWLVFTGFWGSMYYLLSCISLIAGARRRPVKLDARTLGTGYGMHVGTFVVGGSLLSAIFSLVRGKSTSEISEDSISSGRLERRWPLQAVGGAFGSLLPFALAIMSQRMAAKVTGHEAIANEVNWPVAGGSMIVGSGLTALVVARIAAWVAEDAKKKR